MRDLTQKDKSTLVRLALKYPPAVKAILGAALEELNESNLTQPLQKALNPITKYKLEGATKVLAKTANWNII